MLGVGFVGGWFCMRCGDQIPEVGSVLSHYTWGILLVVTLVQEYGSRHTLGHGRLSVTRAPRPVRHLGLTQETEASLLAENDVMDPDHVPRSLTRSVQRFLRGLNK